MAPTSLETVLHSRPARPISQDCPLASMPFSVVALSALGRKNVMVSCKTTSVELEVHKKNVQGSSQVAGTATPVRGVLFDMDGVLCDSEERSRQAAVDFFSELGIVVKPSDFIPFMGTGEANFLAGVASAHGIKDFDIPSAKKRFYEIYIEKYARPNSGLGFSGALELILQCKNAGLKLAVASSADRIKLNANLAAAGLPQTNFDAIVSADTFRNLKPAPDIFLTAAEAIGIPPKECVVIEDAIAGIQASQAAGMRCIAVATTLSEEELVDSGISLVRKYIGDISLSDILTVQYQSNPDEEFSYFDKIQSSLDVEVPLVAGYSTTRRDLIRFGSFGMGLYTLSIAVTRWKAMQYSSPKALLNGIFGVENPPIANGAELGADKDKRVSVFRKYISDLEERGGGQQVPEFQPNLQWLNTTPLRVKQDLRGKVVILDFWTYCCINCMHVLPDLAYIENKYEGQAVAVIGVHSAKFDNEKDTEAIRNAVLRYDIKHPVVNDSEMRMWRKLGVSSWPTLVIVSPEGKVIGMLSGEGHRTDVDDIVAAALDYYGERKLLNNRPIPQLLEKNKDSNLLSTPLSFPGKIATELANARLFISDSNHHRIVVTDLEGNFILQIGCGSEGLMDGGLNSAAFNKPQGVAYNPVKNVLYVADTENHAIREVDFVSETVRTLAGNGTKGSDYRGGKSGTMQVLNSPWDLCFDPKSNKLYIAMAGQHQIWEYDLGSSIAQRFSGDGYERNLNGSRGSNSSYSQPSGICLSPDMTQLYIADSESSSVRSVDLGSGGSKLLAGGDSAFAENLFQFGDKDGNAAQALFQHPLGVLPSDDGAIYVADSYNHKIKAYDPVKQTVRTVAGSGVAGYRDGTYSESQFSEPAGLAQGLPGEVYVADTNNSVIRILKGGVVSTLVLKGVPAQSAETIPRQRLRRRSRSSTWDIERVRVGGVTAASGKLEVQISLPPGYHFTKEAKSKYEVEDDDDDNVIISPSRSGILEEGGVNLRFERRSKKSILLSIICKVFYCQEDEVCLYKRISFEVPLEEEKEEENEERVIDLRYDIKPNMIQKSMMM